MKFNQYSFKDFFCVITSFNPSNNLIEIIKKLQDKQIKFIVIDNNSTINNSINVLKKINKSNIHFNKSNLGVGGALNIGVNYAKKNNVKWIITFDQDSLFNDIFFEEYLKIINEYNFDSLVPNLNGKSKKILIFDFPKISNLITSGHCIKIEALDKINNYNESLFIDGIDYDVFLKLNDLKLKTIRCQNSILIHNIGLSKNKKIIYHKHSAQRRYFIVRNNIYLFKKHYKKNKFLMIKSIMILCLQMFLVIVVEKNRIENLKFILKGINHANKKITGNPDIL